MNTQKAWEDLTTAEKVERLNFQMDNIVRQINQVTMNINQRISNVEADLDKSRKG